MAAYAYSVTPDIIKIKKFGGPNGLAMIWGTVAVSNYNAVLGEIVGITKHFRDVDTIRVFLAGCSTTGYLGTWVNASGSIKAFVTSTGVEVADDVDIGVFDFLALGVSK